MILKNSILDRKSKNYIPCRRDGDKCDCISICKRIKHMNEGFAQAVVHADETCRNTAHWRL